MKIGNKNIDINSPAYFIAEIGSNFDGDKVRARDLIFLAKESGADAAKFQHYTASSLVSNEGFNALPGNLSHQSKWSKSVFEIYQDASLKKEWTDFLFETCVEAGMDFLTSPYSMDLVDYVDKYVPAFKVGSGDITWHNIVKHMLVKNKPVLIATGASDASEVDALMSAIYDRQNQVVLMQCNTNYTGNKDHYHFSHLNVLKGYRRKYPKVLLGLSDHTPGYVTTLGAVALGARVIEKHFTDDNKRPGPDHAFALEHQVFLEMVNRTRELEESLGNEMKKVESNEVDTRVVQRRAIRASKALPAGTVLEETDLSYLRPCPPGSLAPYQADKVINKILAYDLPAGREITEKDLV
jgi:sialic acid synthase SpsE